MERAPADCVRGRDVLERGIAPGPEVGRIVERCREIQDESGWTDGSEHRYFSVRSWPASDNAVFC